MRELILAFFGSLCPAILFNVKKERFFWVGLSGAIGWAAFTGLGVITGQVVLPTFVGALFVGLYSETMARIIKTPALVFSVSGIFPLVPGLGAYQTVRFMVDGKLPDAASKGIETVASAGAIALGIMFMSALFKVVKRLKNPGLPH